MLIMFKKITTEVAALIGSITVIAASVYSTEKTIHENKKLANEKNLEYQDLQNQLNELKGKLELYENAYKEASLKNNSLNDVLTPQEFKDNTITALSKANVNFENINKSSLLSNEDLLISFSTSFILLSLITLSAVCGLIANYYIKLYGDKYTEKVPKLMLPIIKYYLKFTHYSNYYYISIIIFTQILLLLTNIYLKYRGII